MAVPKRKTSKKVKNQRRAHQNLTVPGLIECSNCGELTKPHYVCKSCGHYDGKEVVE
ncbi:MAG TPA: 50S ribosomal protein L32 [Pseudogracilibacillus sp.]|nr:50S ribosomal protein L32 [Pseudogracilibacillus sp.]